MDLYRIAGEDIVADGFKDAAIKYARNFLSSQLSDSWPLVVRNFRTGDSVVVRVYISVNPSYRAVIEKE